MRKPKAPKLVTVAIMTTITIIFWIFLTLYRVLTTKPLPSVDPILLEPINANLDFQSLEKINGRLYFEEGSFSPLQVANPPSQISQPPVSISTTTPEPSPGISLPLEELPAE